MPVHGGKIGERGIFVDVAINRSGPLSQRSGSVSPPIVESALVDTGAKKTMIDRRIAEELGLESVGVDDVYAVGSSPIQSNVYAISFAIVGRVPPEAALIKSLRAVEADLSHLGVRILLGRDVLSRCLLVYNGSLEAFSLAY